MIDFAKVRAWLEKRREGDHLPPDEKLAKQWDMVIDDDTADVDDLIDYDVTADGET